MKIQHNISLKQFNTFGIDVKAKRFVDVTSVDELKEIISSEKEIFILSGGSNMLLTKDIECLVIHLNLNGIIASDIDNNWVIVTAQAGENWHEFVRWCITQNYGGLENLSLIPGNVGASPIQNIGAYGVEIKDTFVKLEALEIKTGKVRTFTLNDCEFGYRASVFKTTFKNQYIILNVSFKLSKKNHQLNTSYGAISAYLKNVTNPTIKDVSDAVIAIRQSKLPNPKEIGNSGSFFKNPIIPIELFNRLQKKYPSMPFYEVNKTERKIPAGWLIEQCGFKGIRIGDAGVHKNQALVLVNYGNASGKEIFDLAKTIQKKVYNIFNIELEIEVNIF